MNESSARLGPFDVPNPDPASWLHVPADFTAPGVPIRYEWARDHASALRSLRPGLSKDDALELVMGACDESDHRFPDHDQYWALLKADAPGETRSLTVVFDLLPSEPGLAQRIEQRLVAGSDAELERHPQEYHEQPTGPGRVADVAAAGLGRGRCVVRRDRHQVFDTPLEQVMHDDERARYRDPAYWDEAISVQWIFDTSAGVLRASVRTDRRDVLLWALPQIGRLLDGISLRGRASVGAQSGPSSNEDLEALVQDAAASAAADEHAVVSRHHWHR